MVDTPAPARPPGAIGRLILRCLAVAVAAAGLWISLDLLRLTLGSKASNPWLAAQCGEPAGDGADCLSVLRSEYAFIGGNSRKEAPTSAPAPGAALTQEQVRAMQDSSAAGRLPWAVLGAAYFAFVGMWYLFIGPATRSRWPWQLFIVLVVGLGAAQSVELLWIMHAQLRQWCVGCVAAHVLNGVLVVLTLIGLPWRRDAAGRRPHPALPLAAATLTCGLLASSLLIAATQAAGAAQTAAAFRREYERIVQDPRYALWRAAQQERVQIPLRDDEPFLGSPAAPHTIVAFVDLECPSCGVAYVVLRDYVLNRYGPSVRVAFRHFPLNQTCNPARGETRHPLACKAAAAVEAARVLAGDKAYQEMRWSIYRQRKQLSENRLEVWGQQLGLDPAALRATMDSDRVRGRIAQDVQFGVDLGVSSVPAIYLDGKRVEAWQQLQNWDALLGPPGAEGQDE